MNSSFPTKSPRGSDVSSRARAPRVGFALLAFVVVAISGPLAVAQQDAPAATEVTVAETPEAESGTVDASVEAVSDDAEDAPPVSSRAVLGAGQTAASARLPFRGTSLGVSTVATALSADRAADLTYNPYLALSLDINPRWWIGRIFYARGAFSLSRELTESDVNTFEGEFEPSDTTLGIGAYRFYTIPVLEIGISAAADVVLPTSKASKARTLDAAYAQTVRIDRSFDVFSGLSLAYTARATEYDHRFTTGESQAPRISTCGGISGSCDPFLNTGVRNPETQIAHIASVSFAPIDSLEVAASGAFYTTYLHDVAESDDVSFDVEDPTDTRWATGFGVSVGYTPAPPVTITVGTNTTNPVLASDGSYRTPFLNRFTLVYLDVTLNVAGLVAAF